MLHPVRPAPKPIWSRDTSIRSRGKALRELPAHTLRALSRSLRKSTQDAARGVYAFVPDLPLDQEWTDAKLYQRYGLNEEIAFIESQVAEHDGELFDEAASDDDTDE